MDTIDKQNVVAMMPEYEAAPDMTPSEKVLGLTPEALLETRDELEEERVQKVMEWDKARVGTRALTHSVWVAVQAYRSHPSNYTGSTLANYTECLVVALDKLEQLEKEGV